MKSKEPLKITAQFFIFFSALTFLYVSLMAFVNPQKVMDLVSVNLNNTDAFSSIRGVYGGVGMAMFISLVYLGWSDFKKGLWLLCLLWGFYAFSRTLTIFMEGALGAFGVQWLIIEAVFFIFAVTLLMANQWSKTEMYSK